MAYLLVHSTHWWKAVVEWCQEGVWIIWPGFQCVTGVAMGTVSGFQGFRVTRLEGLEAPSFAVPFFHWDLTLTSEIVLARTTWRHAMFCCIECLGQVQVGVLPVVILYIYTFYYTSLYRYTWLRSSQLWSSLSGQTTTTSPLFRSSTFFNIPRVIGLWPVNLPPPSTYPLQKQEFKRPY